MVHTLFIVYIAYKIFMRMRVSKTDLNLNMYLTIVEIMNVTTTFLVIFLLIVFLYFFFWLIILITFKKQSSGNSVVSILNRVFIILFSCGFMVMGRSNYAVSVLSLNFNKVKIQSSSLVQNCRLLNDSSFRHLLLDRPINYM